MLYLGAVYNLPMMHFTNTVYSTGSTTFSGKFDGTPSGANSFSGLFTGPAAQELIGNFTFPLRIAGGPPQLPGGGRLRCQEPLGTWRFSPHRRGRGENASRVRSPRRARPRICHDRDQQMIRRRSEDRRQMIIAYHSKPSYARTLFIRAREEMMRLRKLQENSACGSGTHRRGLRWWWRQRHQFHADADANANALANAHSNSDSDTRSNSNSNSNSDAATATAAGRTAGSQIQRSIRRVQQPALREEARCRDPVG